MKQNLCLQGILVGSVFLSLRTFILYILQDFLYGPLFPSYKLYCQVTTDGLTDTVVLRNARRSLKILLLLLGNPLEGYIIEEFFSKLQLNCPFSLHPNPFPI